MDKGVRFTVVFAVDALIDRFGTAGKRGLIGRGRRKMGRGINAREEIFI